MSGKFYQRAQSRANPNIDEGSILVNILYTSTLCMCHILQEHTVYRKLTLK